MNKYREHLDHSHQPISRTKDTYPRTAKRQNSSEIRVTKMSPQMLILLKSSPKICYYFVKYCNLQKNIGPIEDSMYGRKSIWPFRKSLTQSVGRILLYGLLYVLFGHPASWAPDQGLMLLLDQMRVQCLEGPELCCQAGCIRPHTPVLDGVQDCGILS